MIRGEILNALNDYNTVYQEEKSMVKDTIDFIAANPHCFERSLLEGHVTGSAWILNDSYTHALLIHHVKMDKWFQPGGHCDGDPDVMAVAQKEAYEETGMTLNPISQEIFDVDIHAIPEKNQVPEHLHYDIRYAFTTPMAGHFIAGNREILSGEWIPLSEIVNYNDSQSVLRMVNKSMQLIKK